MDLVGVARVWSGQAERAAERGEVLRAMRAEVMPSWIERGAESCWVRLIERG